MPGLFIVIATMFALAPAYGQDMSSLKYVYGTYLGHWPNKSANFFERDEQPYNVVNFFDGAFKVGDGKVFSRPEDEVMKELVTDAVHSGDFAGIPDVLNILRKKGVKTLICVAGGENFSNIINSEASRKCFVRTLVAFMRKHQYDGIAIDWEHSLEKVLDVHYLLMRELREEMRAMAGGQGNGGLLTTALHPYVTVRYSSELARLLCREIDWIDLMTYDMDTYDVHRHNAPAKMIRKYIDRMRDIGFPADKICLGMASYGYIFENVLPGTAAKKGEIKKYISWPRFQSYLRDGWKAVYDAQNEGWHYFSPDGKSFASIDNPEILREKTEYVYKSGIRGIFWWEWSYDMVGDRQVLAEPVGEYLNGKRRGIESSVETGSGQDKQK